MMAAALTLIVSVSAGAAMLSTHARVAFVQPAEAVIDGFDDEGRPTWSLSGETEVQLHVTVEWRTPAGDPLPERAAGGLREDLEGPAVATLVILRE